MRHKYIMFFRDGAAKFSSLKSGCARSYLLWLAFGADKEGRVNCGSYGYANFANYMVEQGLQSYHASTVEKTLTELRASLFLLPGLSRGFYQINPNYIWAGASEERDKVLKDLENLNGKTLA